MGEWTTTQRRAGELWGFFWGCLAVAAVAVAAWAVVGCA